MLCGWDKPALPEWLSELSEAGWKGSRCFYCSISETQASPCPGGRLEAVGSEEVGTKHSFVRHIHLRVLSISVNFDLNLKCLTHMRCCSSASITEQSSWWSPCLLRQVKRQLKQKKPRHSLYLHAKSCHRTRRMCSLSIQLSLSQASPLPTFPKAHYSALLLIFTIQCFLLLKLTFALKQFEKNRNIFYSQSENA